MNVFRNASWMQDLGHDVNVLCVSDSKLHEACLSSNLKCTTVVKNKKYFDYKNAKIVGQIVLDLKAQVLWCCDKNDISILSLAKKYRAKKVLLVYQQNMQIGVAKTSPAHTIRLRRIDLWIAPLHYLKEQVGELTKFSKEKVRMVPLSVDLKGLKENLPSRDTARAYFNLSNEDVVVGMMGRIDPHKSQHLVIDAFLALANDYPNLKLLFVGAKTEGEWDEYYQRIQDKISEPSINSRVSLCDFMDNTAYFYQAIDTFVMASEKETFGMVTVEAMAFGRAVAGTNTAGTKELLENESFGYYFEPRDADSLKEALVRILDNPEVANRKGVEAKNEVKKKYDREITSRQIEKLLFEFIKRKK